MHWFEARRSGRIFPATRRLVGPVLLLLSMASPLLAADPTMPCTVAADKQAVWRAGIDHETYARVDGVWMFRHKRSEPLMSVPFETGWASTRFA